MDCRSSYPHHPLRLAPGSRLTGDRIGPHAGRGKEGSASYAASAAQVCTLELVTAAFGLDGWDIAIFISCSWLPGECAHMQVSNDFADLLELVAQQDVRPSRHDHARRC
jgi:hypothetical protein